MGEGALPAGVALGPKDHLDPQLSPDGGLLSYLAPHGGVSNVWVRDLVTGEARPVTDSDQPIGGMFSYVSALGRSVWHRWAFDGRHILHLRDRDGDEAFHVHAVDIATGATRDLTPFQSIQAVIIGLSPQRPDAVAIQMALEDPTRLDAYRVSISTGEYELVARNPGGMAWIVDRDLDVAGGVFVLDDGTNVLRAHTGEGWRDVFSQPTIEGALRPFGVDERNRFVVSSSHGGDIARIVLVDPTRGSLHEPFPPDPVFDVSAPIPNPATGAVDMIRISRQRTATEGRLPDLKALRDANPEGEALVVSRSLDDQTWLVELSHDDAPISYATWHRPQGRLLHQFDHLAALRRWTLARQRPFTFQSSDGRTIHGYTVAPPGREAKRLPTVVLVHGGPAQRQLWGWGDPYVPFAQWFATRGYLVLLVDYRGSNGYGTSFERAIHREWGGRSLTDLLDAVDHAAAQGWSDPDRVAFWGASFGGYTALAAAAFAGDRIRCAVPIAGISSLLTMVESIPPHWKAMRRHWIDMLGDPDSEPEFLRSRSPLCHVDRITVPLLVVHGANDPRCSPREADQIVEALRARDVPVEYLLLPDEGHVFVKPESWERTLDATERFLAAHL